MADDKGYIQPGYRTITPYLYGGQGLIDFLIDVFGAEVLHGGDVAADGSSHNEVMIGDSRVDFGSDILPTSRWPLRCGCTFPMSTRHSSRR